MRVLVAFDKFKEALSAPEACLAIAQALRAGRPDWTLDLCPLADGGDGFVRSLTAGKRHQAITTRVNGPLGNPVEASWALVAATDIPSSVRARLCLGDSPLAILEMAACSGLSLVPRNRRDPLRSASTGVGQLIFAAARAGAGAILLGVGGSATNDLGLGTLAALGYRFLDADSHPVEPPLPAEWPRINQIIPPPNNTLPPVWIACDVTNPLCGAHGATWVYGPQKGLARETLPSLDAQVGRLGHLLALASGGDSALLATPGAGAAGGIAAGLMLGCGARLVGGFDLVSEWLDLPSRVSAADLVITGEGRFDDTSLQGKGPGGLVRAALAQEKPAVVFAGRIDLSSPPPGLDLRAITPPGMPLARALVETDSLLSQAVTDFLTQSFTRPTPIVIT